MEAPLPWPLTSPDAIPLDHTLRAFVPGVVVGACRFAHAELARQDRALRGATALAGRCGQAPSAWKANQSQAKAQKTTPAAARRRSDLSLWSLDLRRGTVRATFRIVSKFSIVVPAFNEEKLLPATLRTIHEAATAFTAGGQAWELIVCDNNSTDRTAELARAGGAHVVFEPVNQIGRARNTGAAAATGQWLVFIDADSTPSPALFAELAATVADARVVGGGAPVQMDRFYWRTWFFGGVWNAISRLFGWAAGSFLFCETAAFRAVGGFNVELFASEEIDLCRRLKAHARLSRRRMRILRAPLLTSARKLELYARGELLWFALRAAFRPYATVKARDACHIWYDGRR